MTGFGLIVFLTALAWGGGDAREPQFDCSKVKNTYLFSPAGGVYQRLAMGERDGSDCHRKKNVYDCLKPLITNFDPDNDAVDFDAFTKKYAECSLQEYFRVTPSWVELAGNRSELRGERLTRMRVDITVGPINFDSGDVTGVKMMEPEVMLVKWIDNGDSESYIKSQLIENVIRVTSETRSTTRAFKTSQTFGVGPDEVKDEDKKKFVEKNKGKKLSIKRGWQTAKRKFREKARESMEILQGKKEPEKEDDPEEGSSGKGESEKYQSVSDTSSITTITAKMNTFEDTVVVAPKRSAKIVWMSQSRELDMRWEADVFVKGWIAVKANIRGRNLWFLPVGDMVSYFHEFFDYQSSMSMSFTARGVHKSTQSYESQMDVFEFPLRTTESCPRKKKKNNAADIYLENAASFDI